MNEHPPTRYARPAMAALGVPLDQPARAPDLPSSPRLAASGATAVQVVYSSQRGSREIEHLGSTHEAEPEG